MASATDKGEQSGTLEEGVAIDDGSNETSSDEEDGSQPGLGWMQRDSGFPFRSDTISRYHVIMRLGRGGMARVYLARTRTGLSKLVVLKVLEPHLAREPSARDAFQKEATLSALMSHPNVVQVHEVFEAEGTPVMVMEYLEGWPLSEVLKVTRCGLPLHLSLMILGQVLNALHYVHEMTDLEGHPLGAVHRDVSPTNIMILPSGFAKVLDFGVAKATIEGSTATETGIIKGKLRYMAPEQLLGGALDRRVDIFAVGVILWEMLAGRRMWAQVPDSQVVGALVHGAIPELPDYVDAPDPLREAVRRATTKSPNDRFETAHEFAQVLAGAAAELGPPPSTSEIKAYLGDELNAVIRERRELVQNAVKASSSVSVNLDELGALEVSSSVHGLERSGTIPASGLSASTSGELVLSPHRSKRGRLAALAIGVLAIGAFGAYTQLGDRAPHTRQPLVASVPPSVQVTAHPASATIFVNDVEQAKNPAEFPLPTGSWRLRIVSNGHEALERVYDGAPEAPIDVRLEPLPPEDPAASASVSADVTPPTKQEAPRQRAWRPRPAPSPTPEQPPAEQPKPNCSPPYYYAADGTKIFRKECF